MRYPKIYLAIDNCFAYKRWTRPLDWMNVIADLGVRYVEASADTELDPLYMGRGYLDRWKNDVVEAEQKTGVSVANLYSGHGTYTTLGLAHTDKQVRERFVENWFKPMVDAATELDAGFGFLVHGFADFVMQDIDLYRQYVSELYDTLAAINVYAKEKKCKYLALEQMYSPQMIPWTIDGTMELMEQVSSKSSKDFYFTEDIGHHHTKFVMPSEKGIRTAFEAKKIRGMWLGSNNAFDIYYRAVRTGTLSDEDIAKICKDMKEHSYLFTKEEDNDFYRWLRAIGCFAPIIHLQQTNGENSAHLPFTEENNEKGKVNGKKLLLALKESYDKESNSSLHKCNEVFLTLELFYGASAIGQDLLNDYKVSVDYWRRFIPEDGLKLDQLIERLN